MCGRRLFLIFGVIALTMLTGCARVCAQCTQNAHDPGIVLLVYPEVQYVCPTCDEQISIRYSAWDTDCPDGVNCFWDYLPPLDGWTSSPNSGWIERTVEVCYGGVQPWVVTVDDMCQGGNVDDPAATATLYIVGLSADIDADLNGDGTLDQADEAMEEIAPGRLIRCNDDDDNHNGTQDCQESQMGLDDDLVGVFLIIPSSLGGYPELTDGCQITLRAASGGDKIGNRVWRDGNKSSENSISLPKTWTLGTDIVPVHVSVEGCEPSGSEGDVKLEFVCTSPDGSKQCTDAMVMTVLRPDVSTDSDNDGDTDDDDQIGEENVPGKHVWVNRDDDNGNGRSDLYDTDVVGEDGLVRIALDIEPKLPGMTVSVVKTGLSSVRLWADSRKAVQAPTSYAASELPKDVWVEGVSTWNEQGTVHIRLATNTTHGMSDVAVLTVHDMTLSAARLAVMTGGIGSTVHQSTLTAQVTPAFSCDVAYTFIGGTGENIPAKISGSSAATDENGRSQVVYTSSDLEESATVSASVGECRSSVTINQVPGTCTEFLCVPASMPADGESTSAINFRLMQVGTTNEPVPEHAVHFFIDAIYDINGVQVTDPLLWPDYGSITSAQAHTDSTGLAVGVFRVGTIPGTILIRAEDSNDYAP